ncbi:MAG: excisionase family DNA-binding protein [Ktedonobacteraceae bacterium]
MSENLVLSAKIFLSRKEFSLLTGLSLRTTAKLLACRQLRSIRVGRRRLIPRAELSRFSRSSHSTKSAPRRKVGR